MSFWTSVALGPTDSQLSQQIGSKARATTTGRDYEVGLQNIGPFDRQRAQPSAGARIGHAITAPVVTYREQVERLPPQWMEGMDDSENLCAVAWSGSTRVGTPALASLAANASRPWSRLHSNRSRSVTSNTRTGRTPPCIRTVMCTSKETTTALRISIDTRNCASRSPRTRLRSPAPPAPGDPSAQPSPQWQADLHRCALPAQLPGVLRGYAAEASLTVPLHPSRLAVCWPLPSFG
jgi:hypothetical protein